jgi:hypothetical protein
MLGIRLLEAPCVARHPAEDASKLRAIARVYSNTGLRGEEKWRAYMAMRRNPAASRMDSGRPLI